MVDEELDQGQEEPSVDDGCQGKAGVELPRDGEDHVDEGTTQRAEDVQNADTLKKTLKNKLTLSSPSTFFDTEINHGNLQH